MEHNNVAVSSVPVTFPTEAAPCEDFSRLSLDALLSHKSWRARREAFERIRDNPRELRAHLLEQPRRLMGENNAAAQEALFEALAAIVDVCSDDELTVLAGEPLRAVIERGITGRPRAVGVSCKFVSDLVGAGKQKEVFDVLLPAFGHRTPKNRMASAQLCGQIVGEYGVAGLPIKAILKAMQPLFNDANVQVRKEAVALCCQCYKFIGAGIKGFLTDLRDVQLQELDALFEEITVGEAPPKRIRGMSLSTPVKPAVPLIHLVSHNGTSNDLSDEEYELHDETPVLPRLPRNFYRAALDKTAKWQDRVAMVQDNLLPLISAPKIRLKDDYHELASLVWEFLIDPQAPLMLVGFKCIQELARAMRAAFAPYARSFINPLFDKMKDKKASVVEHITTTLDTLIRYKGITLEQCQDEIELTTQSRVPNQRLALIQWLTRLADRVDRSNFTRMSRSQGMFGRLLNDEKVEIREAGYVLTAKLITLMGEANFQALLGSLDDKQRTKLTTAMNTAAQLQCTPTCSPAKKTRCIERRENSSSSMLRSLSIGAISTGFHSNTRVRRPCHSSLIPRQSSPEMRRQHTTVDDSVTLEATLPSKDESTTKMMGLLGGDISVLEMLRSKEWGSRYNGVMKVREMVDGWTEKECTQYFENVLVCLRVDPGWRESIFQVFQAMTGVFQELVNRATTVSPGASFALISGCTCRLTEPKNKNAIRNLITSLVKTQGLPFVIRHIIGDVTNVKTPRLLQECNEYMTYLLQKFPASHVDVKCVVDYVNSHCFGQQFPAVRSSGITLLVSLRIQLGQIVDNYMSNVDPALRSAYEESISSRSNREKRSHRGNNNIQHQNQQQRVAVPATASPNSPFRVRKGEGDPLSTPGYSQQGGGGGGVMPNISSSRGHKRPAQSVQSSTEVMRMQPEHVVENEESPTRTDVSQQLIALAKQITNSADWRERLDAVKKVDELIYINNKRISPHGVVEILRALRTRFDEVNKNFVIDVLRTFSLIVESAGREACRPELKSILQGVLGMLGDKKVSLRDEAVNVAYMALDVLGLDLVLQCMHKPLTAESHECNKTALELIERGFHNEPDAVISKQVVISLVPDVVRLCMCRILDVRFAAERVIGKFLPLIGDEAVLRAVQNLRPAEQQSVMAPIERQIQIFLRTANNEELRRTSTFASLASVHAPSGGTPRSPRSPRTGSGSFVSASHKSVDNIMSSQQGGQASTLTSHRTSVSRESSSQHAKPMPVSIVSPLSMSATAKQASSQSQVNNDYALSIQDIMVGLRSASPSTAANTCTELSKRIENGENCGTPKMIQVIVERLYENIKSLDVRLALGLITCLKAIFERHCFAQSCHSSLLFRILGMIFDCLLSATFSLHEEVIKALNNMTLKLLEGCPGNDVFSALMSRMTRYSAIYTESGKKSDLRYIQVTVKCLMRLDFEEVSPDNIILCCHEYLLQHPPSAFRNLDDLSIRTVKTILQDISRRSGPPLLPVANRLVGTQNLVTHFIRACLENREKLERRNSGSEQTNAVGVPGQPQGQQRGSSYGQQGQQHQQQKAGSPPESSDRSLLSRSAHVDPQASVPAHNSGGGGGASAAARETRSATGDGASLSTIFSRIRNHVTSSQGIEELYAFIKQNPDSQEFDQQFYRCSEAFRSYIKRKMERQMMMDTTKVSGFSLPKVMRQAP